MTKSPILSSFSLLCIHLSLFFLIASYFQPDAYANDFVTDTDSVTVPEGGTASFKVKLSKRPKSLIIFVTIGREEGDNNIFVQTNTLTFARSNKASNSWNKFQTVTLFASEDSDTTNGIATIRISASSISAKRVIASEDDNDFNIAFVTNTDDITVPEGGTATFQVKLSGQPSSDVEATVSNLSGDNDISVQSDPDLTFDESNWDVFQTVILAAAEDADSNDGTAIIGVRAPDLPGKNVNAAESDNDVQEFITNTDSVSIFEGSTATFQVKLAIQPSSPVTATVIPVDGDTDITVESGGDLTFDDSNWDDFKTVILAAAEDADSINGTATIRVSAAGIEDEDIIATELDNESITVTSPNGGEILLVETSHEITWASGGSTGSSVTIELHKGGVFSSSIIPSTPNDGSFTWNIPSSQEVGSDFRVRISSSSDGSISDESDNDFSLSASDEDNDGDGVPDREEMGPDGNDLLYDGNRSGRPDGQERNAASLHTHDFSHYVTLEGSGELSGVRAVAPPPGAPQDTTFPYGFFEFTINGVTPGGPSFAIIYGDTSSFDVYHKFGATPQNPIPHWYEFSFDAETVTGAEFNGSLITLHFVDGQKGDDDLSLNGVVIDQGGPGITGAGSGEVAGKDCFIATAAFGSKGAPSLRILREFRDAYLLTNRAGIWFVKNYYRYSPPLAKWLTRHEIMRVAVGFLLIPVVALSWLLLNSGLTLPLLALIGLFGFSKYYIVRSNRIMVRKK